MRCSWRVKRQTEGFILSTYSSVALSVLSLSGVKCDACTLYKFTLFSLSCSIKSGWNINSITMYVPRNDRSLITSRQSTFVSDPYMILCVIALPLDDSPTDETWMKLRQHHVPFPHSGSWNHPVVFHKSVLIRNSVSVRCEENLR